MKISALIVARNEEKKIESTLKSLNFADEIIVILDRTTDNTESICRKYTKHLYQKIRLYKSNFWFKANKQNI